MIGGRRTAEILARGLPAAALIVVATAFFRTAAHYKSFDCIRFYIHPMCMIVAGMCCLGQARGLQYIL